MGKSTDPKRMTDLALRSEHVKLDREIKKLQKHPDQSQSYYEAEELSKRKLILKEELDRRVQAREAKQQADSQVTAHSDVTGPEDLPQFVTADGAPYRP